MTNRLKEAVKHAKQVQKLYRLNIMGNTLAMIEEVAEEAGEVGYDNLNDAWNDYGDDLLTSESVRSEGHMSRRDIEIMELETRELAEIVIEECESLDEIRSILADKK